MPRSIKLIKDKFPTAIVITDVALDPYSSMVTETHFTDILEFFSSKIKSKKYIDIFFSPSSTPLPFFQYTHTHTHTSGSRWCGIRWQDCE